MRLTTLLLITAILDVSASGFAQQVTLSENNTPLIKVFNKIRQQTGIGFLVSSSMLKDSKPVTIRVSNKDLNEVLKEIFKNQNLDYTIEEKSVVVSRKSPSFLEQVPGGFNYVIVIGRVLSENSQPLEGVSVKVKNSKLATKTGTDGRFELRGVDEHAVLQISYIGYELKEVRATENLSQIKLSLATGKLDEIQISASTGYQLIPKERATGAFDVISAKQIQNKIQTNVLERLEGLAPGLMMINGRDNGKDDGLTIRGVSTLYGTKRPLIVVDNFPIEGDISTVNPNDVESITVLKDAAAASIWGARAANGVIVISTKKGKQGDIEFNYTNSFQFQAKPNLDYLNRLGAAEDIAIDRKIVPGDYTNRLYNTTAPYSQFAGLYMDSVLQTITPDQYAAGIQRLSSQDNTRQIKDLLMQQPFTQNHALSFNGANEKNQFYGSVNYTDQNGYELKDHKSIYNVFLKNRYTISNKLTFGINANFNMSNSTSPPVSSIAIFKLKPYDMLQDTQDNPLAVPMASSDTNVNAIAMAEALGLGDQSYYPLNALNNKEITSRTNGQRIQAELNYKLIDGIDLGLSYQLEKSNIYSKTYIHAGEAELLTEINSFVTPTFASDGSNQTNSDGTLLNPTYNLPIGGKINEIRTDGTSHVLRAVLNVNKTFSMDHQVSGVIGVENRSVQTSGNDVTKYGYDDNTLAFINVDVQRLRNFSSTMKMRDIDFIGIKDRFYYHEDRFVSAFANASYSYQNKYVYSGSIRIDQTNLFGTNPKYLYRPLWSSGLSWIVSNENFLKGSDLVNYLQIRSTYGLNGNIPKNAGPFMIATKAVNYFNNQPNNMITTPANSDLKWEKTGVVNFGLDFSILKNRVTGKFDYYSRKSSDLLAEHGIDPTLGFSNATLNTASMKNDGFEIELNIKNIAKDNFSWSTLFTYAINKSKITKVDISKDYLGPIEVSIGSPYITGSPYGALYSIRYGGLTADNGQLLVKNAQGGIQADVRNENLDFAYYTGNTRPVSSGSLGNIFNYKNLEMSFMFVFYLGHVARQSSLNASPDIYSFDGSLADAWKKPGNERSTAIPNILWDRENYFAARFFYADILDVNVFNTSYAKLREVTLTYSFPKSILSRFKYIKGLQLNAQARNLWTLTKNKLGIDPEAFVGGTKTMPVMATYAFGVNFKF